MRHLNMRRKGKRMAANERQKTLINRLRKADAPVSGGHLAEVLQVSRQIIVQDVQTLREQGYDILSTPRGYVLKRPDGVQRVFKVYHTDDETEKELTMIVDLGGEIEDVFIYHKIYGEVRAQLKIRSRKDVQEFCDALRAGKSSPLKNATAGFHYHTIWTREAEDMDRIEQALREQGYLAELKEYEPESLLEK